MKFSNLIIKQKPFPYFCTILEVDDQKQFNSLFNWFEHKARWEYSKTDFYEQYELDMKKVNVPENVKYFISMEFENILHILMESIFKKKFHKNLSVIAHKLINGQSIGIHNDYLSDEDSETHRLLLQINDGWEENQGGILIFFDNSHENNITDAFVPINQSIQGFEISSFSHHAVSTIYSDKNRYTLVYNFKEL